MKEKIKIKLKDKLIDLSFLWQFSVDDFKNKYAGSTFGIIWAFLQPLFTILIYWFIFQLGFKTQPVKDFPFILWLISGLTAWFFISEAIANSTSCLMEYSYLVKKVLFHINILPLAKVISVLLVQFFLVIFAVVLFAIYGYFPDLHYLQIIYYMVYMVIFASGIAYFTSCLCVFFKDIAQIVPIVLQLAFWTTPIVWDFAIMPDSIKGILRLTPLYYVTEGYRDAFINKIWFWEKGPISVYYWIVAIAILIIGMKFFEKFKPHFADVL